MCRRNNFKWPGEIKKEYKIPGMKRASNFCAVNM